eukprot:CAMPEP_0177630570 /NCGR_PEP_ID=MMETSP0447-20121125/1279_1 /TAXON_ID=0 /ORGANISM="Stygamoeba regulata, Strain BSH-02190019" /LENGTH=268 /DNA_ID=CAMNT_0019131981 /DNA_START=266 /DNA_END=1072 /DNA_ORIENTATION=+
MSRVSPNIAKIPTGTDLQLASRLAAVPYGQIIGGAFTAATDAQFSSAMVCVDWIKSVGFTGGSGAPGDMGELVMVDFVYERPGGLMGLNNQKNVVSVPFLTMVPLPSLRIESMKIQFNVKLNHTSTSATTFSGTTTGIGSQQSEKSGSKSTSNINTTGSTSTDTSLTETGTGSMMKEEWKTSTSMFGMVTDTAMTKQGYQVSREYSMKISVDAVQDAMPAGTQRIMDILASLIEKKSGDVGMSELMNSAFNLPGAGAAAAAPAAAPTV